MKLFLTFAVLILEAGLTLGSCPTMKDPCRLNGYSYTGMCDCSSQPPTQCSRPSQTCKSCMFQGSACSTQPNSPPCCSVLNGQSFCNTGTGKCQSVPYCPEDGTNCPFNDLSPLEIMDTVNVIKSSGLFPSPQFQIIRVQEPPKYDWISGQTPLSQRVAYLTILDPSKQLLSEVLVDLIQKSIISRVDLPGALPLQTIQEVLEAKTLILNDPRTKLAYLRRSLNPKNARFIVWPVGASGPLLHPPGKRLARAVTYYFDPQSHWLWNPVEGLQITVDLNTMSITEFLDTETLPISPSPKFTNTGTGPKLKPLIITQTQGSGITIRGQQIRWYKWRLMYSMDPVHGLQIFHVRYQADCSERLVLYKASISEMLVPYGAEGQQWRWRRAFDLGEYGLGNTAIQQRVGLDVPENSLLLNCTQYDSANGPDPRTLEGCIAVYERDSGMLYKHTDFTNSRKDGRRGRQMILSFGANIGNYVYIYEYIFNMDGVLQVNVRLTGTVLPRGVSPATNDKNCVTSCVTLINEYLIGPVHQHYFNYRLDFDLDGPLNYVMQVDVTNDPIGPDNPDGGAFSPKKRIIKFESSRDYDVEHSRSWHVINGNSRNKFNTPRGYAIKPGEFAYSYSHFGSPYLPQSEFVAHPFWATAYKDQEQGAAGTFPRTGIPYQGLPNYIKDHEPLENVDLVTWYTVGVTHTTRPEEWPVMNIHQAGFSMIPYNFMSQNSELPLKGVCP